MRDVVFTSKAIRGGCDEVWRHRMSRAQQADTPADANTVEVFVTYPLPVHCWASLLVRQSGHRFAPDRLLCRYLDHNIYHSGVVCQLGWRIVDSQEERAGVGEGHFAM